MTQVIPRPSAANRWASPIGCPGSVPLEAHFPDDKSEQALEGDTAHELAAQCITAASGMSDPVEFVDRKLSTDVYVTPEMAEYVQEHLDFLGSIAPLEEWLIEDKIKIPTISVLQGGTPDAWHFHIPTGVLTIADLKYGWGIVEVFENWQLLNYAEGIRHLLQSEEGRFQQIDRIDLVISQPRPYHPDGRVRTWSITSHELANYAAQLAASFVKACTHEPPINTGKHCRDCKALRACPAAREAALNAVTVAGIAMLEEYTGAELAAELELFDHAEAALITRKAAIVSLATQRINSADVVPGWACKRSFGRQTWRPQVTIETIKSYGALMGIELTKEKPITPNQAKKAGLPESLVDQNSHTPETGVKLVRQDASATARKAFGDEYPTN